MNWSDDRLNLWMGWSATSHMASHYGKARSEDIANAYLEMTGQKVVEQE